MERENVRRNFWKEKGYDTVGVPAYKICIFSDDDKFCILPSGNSVPIENTIFHGKTMDERYEILFGIESKLKDLMDTEIVPSPDANGIESFTDDRHYIGMRHRAGRGKLGEDWVPSW